MNADQFFASIGVHRCLSAAGLFSGFFRNLLA
jgi:hypothetical protein